MLSDSDLRRYARNISLPHVGIEGQEALQRARVLVIGAGGLGSPLLSYLAAAGVGHLGVADFDRVELSNLQRQILHEEGDIGRLKAESARDRISEMNPGCDVTLYTEKVTTENAAELLRAYDIVADGNDNFATRFAVNEACLRERKPLISASLRGWEGQVATFKSYLRGEHACYRCFVSADPQDERGCRDAGIMGAFAGMVGSLQALEVIKEVLGIGTLTNRLLSVNGLTLVTKISLVLRDPVCQCCGHLQNNMKNK